MKNEYILKSTVLLLTLFITTLVNAQTTHTIILTCDTSNITKENVNEVCSFGQGRSISNKDYTLDVRLGDVIVWRGLASNSDLSSTIKLEQVDYQGGRNVFVRNALSDDEGIITGEVVQGEVGDEEKYDLKFRVYIDGRRLSDKFVIDPRIRIIR